MTFRDWRRIVWRIPARALARRARRFAIVAPVFAALLLVACEKPPNNPNRSAAAEQRNIPPPRTPPQYSFAADLRTSYPEIAGFVQQFLETCLAGDYTGYRKLASRTREPESEERFRAVYYAIESVTVESIEPLDVRDLPQPAYLVVTAIDFHSDTKVSLRGENRRIAIIVLREAGEWRMLPAPSSLQPHDEPTPTTTSAPASAPDYPWDEIGDY